jgi:hypothetical protein
MENKKNNSTTILVIVALVLLILCLCLSCIAGGLLFFSRNQRVEYQNEPVLETIEPTAFPSPEDSQPQPVIPELTPEGDATQPHALTEQQQRIIERAEEIRGLTADTPVKLVFRSRESLKEMLMKDFEESVTDEEFEQDRQLLALLGFIPEDFDLKTFYVELYAENIAGFYDAEINEMNLIDDSSEMENSLTLAHEYNHFLVYENFDPKNNLDYTDENCKDNSEYCLIISTIIEGDASLTETLLTAEKDLNLKPTLPTVQEPSVIETAPKYFLDSLLFPYTDGYLFVAYQYRMGGFEAVNNLYKNPPASIEQIIHPERYPADEPIAVSMDHYSRIIDEQCEFVRESTLNEADLNWILSSAYDEKWRISEKDASVAADGWGGGAFRYYQCGGEPMFFAKVVWDSIKDADEFNKALSEQFSLRFGKPGATGIWKNSDGLLASIKPDRDMTMIVIAPSVFDSESLLDLLDNSTSL